MSYDPFQASASSVSTFELCPRKWAWAKLDGLESPQHPSAAFGTSVHGHIQQWLQSRVVPGGGSREEKVAQAIIAHLPPPQLVDPNLVEAGLSIRLGGVYFIGYMDLFVPKYPETGRPRVYDHKTTSNFDWALAPETMVDDVQATLYAAWAQLKTNALEVDLQWTYGLTKGAAKSLPVVRTVRGADIKERLCKTIETAKIMREVALAGDVRALDLPYKADACEAYGGCPFQKNCNLSAQERIESIMSQGTAQVSLLEQLRQKRETNRQPPTPASTAQAVNPPQAASPAEFVQQANGGAASSPLERLRAARAAAAAAPAPVEAPVPAPAAAPAATTVLEQRQPAPTPGPGRPRKPRAVPEQVAAPEPVVMPDLNPKGLWVVFAAAALAGGKSGDEAKGIAADMILEHAELFKE